VLVGSKREGVKWMEDVAIPCDLWILRTFLYILNQPIKQLIE
jgi:hypothetical protein